MDDAHTKALSAHHDKLGHMPGCSHYGKEPPAADEDGGCVDLFCECHRFLDPLILANGTRIAWPAGWTESEADSWRAQNKLAQ
jgi:hypothetical protein